MIDEIICKASEMDNDALHLIDDKLDKIITQARKNLKSSLKIRLYLTIKIKISLYLKLNLRININMKIYKRMFLYVK